MGLKISNFMISLVLVSLIAGVFGLFMSSVAEEQKLSYDNSSMEIFNQLENISDITESVKNKTSSVERESTGVFDALSGFFSDAYQAVLITAKSFTTFEIMTNHALDEANIGQATNYFRIALISIVIIAIFVGVIIAIIVKRDV